MIFLGFSGSSFGTSIVFELYLSTMGRIRSNAIAQIMMSL